MCNIPSEEIVLKARPTEEGGRPHFAPMPLEEVLSAIAEASPALVCAPHVATAPGIMLLARLAPLLLALYLFYTRTVALKPKENQKPAEIERQLGLLDPQDRAFRIFALAWIDQETDTGDIYEFSAKFLELFGASSSSS